MIEEHNTQAEQDVIVIVNDIDLEPNLVVDADDLKAVEVQVEKIAERQRRITANIKIPQPAEKIWKVLTDYEALVEFVPNLAKSRLIEHPSGGTRLEQVGSQKLLKFNFCARVVLDLEEYFPDEITFRMVEGDFKGFSGKWYLQPLPEGVHLFYTVTIWPKLTMPVTFIERRLSHDLQLNLLAVRKRVNELCG